MRRIVPIVVSALVALVSCSPAKAPNPPATGPLELRFDAAEARAQGWAAADASEQDVQQAMLAFVRWRLSVAGVEHELVPTATGAEVRVPESRPEARAAARGILAALGACEFYVVAEEVDTPGLAAERARFEAWQKEHPARPLLEYDADPARPAPEIAWLPMRYGDMEGPPFAVLLPRTAADSFGSDDFERVFATKGNLDYPAIGLELAEERVDDFASFTGRAVQHKLAIVLASTVRSAPVLNSRLVGSAI
ncbi:MAG: hypothetical protein ABL998_15665, partial [Planctomycetota bacterium]